MSNSHGTAPGENCPEELLIEVLFRLPVKSLLRFTAVSKSWLSLITSPSFVKSQAHHAIKSNAGDDKTLIVNLFKYAKGSSEDVSFALFQPTSGQLLADLKLPYSKHDYRVTPRSDIGVVCVCVCVFVSFLNYEYNIYLWNPATKLSKRIPNFCIKGYDSLGYGFDPIDSDFKVVRIRSRQYSDGHYSVYSANRDSWGEIKPYPPGISCIRKFHVRLHRYLCGMGTYGMVCFDLNKEVFCNVKLPVSSFHYSNVCMTDFKDSIAFAISSDKGDKIYLWTLDDEACLGGGGLEATTQSIDCGSLPQFVKGYFKIGDFKQGFERKDSFSGNYNNVTRNVLFCYKELEVFKYTETLVSIARSNSKQDGLLVK